MRMGGCALEEPTDYTGALPVDGCLLLVCVSCVSLSVLRHELILQDFEACMAEVYLHSRCARICPCSVACCFLYICLAVGDRSTSQRRDRAGSSRAPHGLLAVASRLDMGYLQAFLQRLPAPLYSRAVGAVSSAPADAAGG